jgi:hypothetical protein
MLDGDRCKVLGRGTVLDQTDHNDNASRSNDDHPMRPVTLAILALLFSPFFLIGIPLAHLALSSIKQHPHLPRTTKALAVLALVLSYAGMLVVALLALQDRRSR